MFSFAEYSINSILYQRGIYPPEDFQIVRKYNLNVLVTLDSGIKAYIKKIIGQLHKWLLHGKIRKLVVAIVDKDTSEAVELWQFDVEVLSAGADHDKSAEAFEDKPDTQIQREIQTIIRQITASITFLPVLDPGQFTFNVQVYADQDAHVPADEWADSEARLVKNAEHVQLKSFSTNKHQVSTVVAYKLGDDA